MAEEKAIDDCPKTIPTAPVEAPPFPFHRESLTESHRRHNQLVNVRARNVSVKVDPAAGSPFSSIEAFKAKVLRSKVRSPIKEILKDVSADLPSRSLTAIVGASGSGKTTLLNVIAQRIKDHKFQQAGNVSYEPFTKSPSPDAVPARVGMAYVLQQDVLLPTLTVRETLQYAADLRLSTTKTKAERQGMVETVIGELGLETCANTRIGDNVHKGCSGGEKRRTSIGVQLLADQPILILDEPTTGLDAASAIQVVQTLKILAQRGKTVIMTSKSFIRGSDRGCSDQASPSTAFGDLETCGQSHPAVTRITSLLWTCWRMPSLF